MPQRQPLKSHFVVCALVLLPATVIAQTAQPAPSAPASGACYEMLPADANTLPGSPMLINKCTGQTYVLTRAAVKASGGPKYRWLPIALSDAPEGKFKDDAPQGKSKRAPAGHNCFSFDGRQFCP